MKLKIFPGIVLTFIILTACKNPLADVADSIACEAARGILEAAKLSNDSKAIADAQKEVDKSCK